MKDHWKLAERIWLQQGHLHDFIIIIFYLKKKKKILSPPWSELHIWKG